MHRAMVLTGSLLFTACAPQNVSLEGDFTALLSDNGSVTLDRGNLKLDEFDRQYAIDCRDFATARSDEENEVLRLNNRLPLCRGDVNEDGVTVSREDWPPQHETWLDNDGFVVVGSAFDPWRGEAIITSEGDVQIAFHQRLPGGEDFRFAIAVDPDFQPRTCVQSEDGEGVDYAQVDGDWIGNWSQGLEEGDRMFYMNSGAYQFNPQNLPALSNPDPDQWYLPNEWQAGFSRGRFADDLFRVRPTRFATPESYFAFADFEGGGSAAAVSRSDLFHCPWAGEEFDPNYELHANCVAGQEGRMETIADEVLSEYELIDLPLDSELFPSMRPRVHANAWRTPDDSNAGLDGWLEFHYSWIRFDAGSELETGGAATGEFQMVFDANDSPSRFFVRGKFNVSKFKRDTWTTEYLPPTKFAENNSTLCGTEVLPPDNF
jgi:hypothetical protein